MSVTRSDFVSPIDAGRYGRAPMRNLFSDTGRYGFFVAVEAALARAQARRGVIPEEAARVISAQAERGAPDAEQIAQREAKSHHELMAVVRTFAASCGDHGRHVHRGATSSDIIDTTIALQLRAALDLLDASLRRLLERLATLAEAHRTTPMVGRTHAQHALPITFGFKAALWTDELLRHWERLAQLAPRVAVGKMAGAVGTFAAFGDDGPALQREVMDDLGLGTPAITSQVVSRDRIAEVVCWAALVAASLETISTDVRNLQRPEIGEVAEFFEERHQVGSSTMPHKRNPVLAENVCGLARIVRSLVVPALETVPLWHERDLTNSSVERFTLPQAMILLDEMLDKTWRIVDGLTVDAGRMAHNLSLSHNEILAERVMLELVERGMDRPDAYATARTAAAVGRDRKIGFAAALAADPETAGRLDDRTLERLLDPTTYMGEAERLTDRVVEHCRRRLDPADRKETPCPAP